MDLTPPSLLVLDEVAAGFGYSAEFEQGVLPAMAAYVGEVVVRSGGGHWVMSDPSTVVTRTGFPLDPSAAVRARARDPQAPSLGEVFSYAMAGAPVPTDEVYASGGRFGDDLQWSMWSWAALCAAERAVAGIVLDFSPDSLDVLDDECDTKDAASMSEDAWGYYQLTMGGYLGELVRRAIGVSWANTEYGPALEISQGNICFPLGKVIKRIEDGPEDSLRGFYDGAIATFGRPDAG